MGNESIQSGAGAKRTFGVAEIPGKIGGILPTIRKGQNLAVFIRELLKERGRDNRAGSIGGMYDLSLIHI